MLFCHAKQALSACISAFLHRDSTERRAAKEEYQVNLYEYEAKQIFAEFRHPRSSFRAE